MFRGSWFGIAFLLVWGGHTSLSGSSAAVRVTNPVGVSADLIGLPCASSVDLPAGVVTGGGTLSGIVKLNTPAPSSGLTITLSSSHPTARVAGQVTAQPGQMSAGFTVSTTPVATGTTATITASTGSCSASAGVSVQPAVLAGLELSVHMVRGNSSLTGTLTLNGPAPAGGAVVRLQSSDPLIEVPASIAIPAGESSSAFPITTGLALSPGSIALTATYEASVQSALLTLQPGI